MVELATETVFTWGAPPVKFGAGAADELAHDLAQLGVERPLLVTDPGVAATGTPERLQRTLREAGLKAEVFDGAHVEPTDESLRAAVEHARGGDWDGFLAVGGGSSIDTAKAVNLLTSGPGDIMEYVNPPVGQGRAPSGPLKPLVAVPTTAGTGAESTPVCVLDVLGLKVKTGISHPRLRPALAVVDPLLTLTLPPQATAASGMDVVCHALEAYTARRFTAYRRKPADARAAYCGANPVSDAFCERALRIVAGSLRRAVLVGDDLEARTAMALAATFAGMGFGNAGVHLPHACAYPIAGMVRGYHPDGYPGSAPLVPHGQSVSVTAPACFRFTFPADPERHRRAAELLAEGSGAPHERGGLRPPRPPRPGAPVDRAEAGAAGDDGRELLPRELIRLLRDLGIPNGIGALGYGEGDVDELVAGTLKQERLLVIAPRDATADDLAGIFRSSLRNW
jgi:hydroxyacid-oxoacid transhydrogenase